MYNKRYRSFRGGKKWKFYKHLRVYLLVNLIMGVLAFRESGEPMEWLPVAFFWGLGLLFHYLRVFRPRASRPWSRGWEGRLLTGERHKQEELDLGRMRPRRKAWDERDLV